MRKNEDFGSWTRRIERDDSFHAEKAALRAAEEIFVTMERLGVTRAELARRLGTSAAYVTKILRGNANFTLASLARLARALDSEITLHMAPTGTCTRWIDAPLTAEEPHLRFLSTAHLAAPTGSEVAERRAPAPRKAVQRQSRPRGDAAKKTPT